MKKLIKKLLREEFEAYKEPPIKDKKNDMTFVEVNDEWSPLYKFLENIFGDKYKDAANSFMFMNGLKIFNKKILYYYKHGITRKGVMLDDNGIPFDIEYGERYRYKNPEARGGYETEREIKSLDEIPYELAFKKIYGELGKHLAKFDKFKGDEYFASYSEFKNNRDEILKKLGYNVKTINNKTNLDL